MKADDVIGLLKEMRIEEALKAADEVVDKVEMASKLTEFAGALDYLKGRHEVAKLILQKSLLLHYDNPYTHYNMGVLLSSPDVVEKDGHSLEKAVKAYKYALKLKPDFHQARYNLALLHYFSGNIEAAAREYETLKNEIGDDILYRGLGMMLLNDSKAAEDGKG
jgi:tetratricopeptide (TPR) repeat protein